MAINSYIQDGKKYYKVYIQAFGKKDKSLRVQRSKFKISSLGEARKVERKLIESVCDEINNLEGIGLKWLDILCRWEIAASLGLIADKYKDLNLRQGHVGRLRKHTSLWFDKVASSLTKGDGRMIINQAKEVGLSISSLKKLRSSINVVFKWGIEEKLILGLHSSPVDGLYLGSKEESVPKILSLAEIKYFLSQAQEQDHPWYVHWAFAFLTGMRGGELRALQWQDIDFEKNIISVSKSFCQRQKKLKCTKAGYWRTVPISSELYDVINALKSANVPSGESFVLPEVSGWRHGDSSSVLRGFLTSIGIDKKIVFHTLRACFATHMLALGADQATVMKIGGWKDIKTFQIYIRLAGVDVRGATDILKLLPVTNSRQDKKVISLFAEKRA